LILHRHIDLVVNLLPDRRAVGQRLQLVNLSRGQSYRDPPGFVAPNRFVLMPELAVLIAERKVLPDEQDPVVEPFQSTRKSP